MRALVIGADGFAGRWLLRHLVTSGDEVTAAVGPRFAGDPLPDGLEPHRLDVRDADATNQLVRDSFPEAIYFLAGISKAGDRDDLTAAIGVSVHGALNVLSAAAQLRARPVRLLHVGSSHMYANPLDHTPIRETWPLRPASVYGAAKAATEGALLHLGPAAGVDVIAVRAFNHIGPGQSHEFVVSSLVVQAVGIRHGEQEPVLHVGSLSVERDFTDVRDVVRAYRLLVLDGRPGEAYNVASGVAVSIRTLVDLVLALAETTADVRTDPRLVRSDDPLVFVGDPHKLQTETGWERTTELTRTLRDVINELELRPKLRS